MPELPEVETIVLQLAPRLRGRTLRRIEVLDKKIELPDSARAIGARVADVFRRGKLIVLKLAPRKTRGGGGTLHLAIHLRMTGRLIYGEEQPVNQRKPRAIFAFDKGNLYFIDTRRFGVVSLVESIDDLPHPGIDPTKPAFTAKRLAALLEGSPTPIKTWLMRQDRLAGIGNIYASEILFDSRIHPDRPAGSLDAAEIARLVKSTRSILSKAIRNCGVTFSDFQDAHGVTGSYQRFLKVYGKAGKPCPRCGTAIRRQVHQQRSTFFCPKCQK